MPVLADCDQYPNCALDRKQPAPSPSPPKHRPSIQSLSTMASGTATVKAVISGDTLVLIGAATNGPPPELVLTLASLQAPRLARSAEASNEVRSCPVMHNGAAFCIYLCVRMR